jgi:DNA-binding GntR family transcriptional regulator
VPVAKDTEHADTSRSGAIYSALRQAISDHALLPGDKLPEDTIGERFGASRTLVREALMRLKAEGLVDMQPNRGAAVARPSLDEARDIFAARSCLEREVLTTLAATITAQQLDTLDAHVAKEQEADGKDDLDSIRFAGEFHVLLAEMSGNRVIARYIDELVSRCALIIALYGQPHSSDCAVSEHRAIIDALRKKKGADASALMVQHLGAVEDRALLAHPTRRPDIRDILGRYAQRRARAASSPMSRSNSRLR